MHPLRFTQALYIMSLLLSFKQAFATDIIDSPSNNVLVPVILDSSVTPAEKAVEIKGEASAYHPISTYSKKKALLWSIISMGSVIDAHHIYVGRWKKGLIKLGALVVICVFISALKSSSARSLTDPVYSLLGGGMLLWGIYNVVQTARGKLIDKNNCYVTK